MNVSHIAYSTVNLIVREVFGSYKKGVSFTVKKLESKLREEGIEDDKIQRLVEVVSQFDPFEKAREQLEKESKRITFLNTTFPNVKPETVLLSPKSCPEKHSYQYVPLRASLKLLLEDETFLRQKFADPYHCEEGLIQDVRDEEGYRSNSFFTKHPEAVPIILFQDELEVYILAK
jgi:hypothetical protein